MKKGNCYLLLLILLVTTGCSAEYNLKIGNNQYLENINITSNNPQENSFFPKKWTIPINKDEYNTLSGLENNNIEIKNIYNESNDNNTLNFNYNFNLDEINNSTAISMCYKHFNIMNENNQIVISTSNKANCFETNPLLDEVTINIQTDLPIIKSNADNQSNNQYTWKITKENSNDKPINIIFDNQAKEQSKEPENNQSNNNQTHPEENSKPKQSYILYIFLGILLLIILFIYLIISKKSKESNSGIDD